MWSRHIKHLEKKEMKTRSKAGTITVVSYYVITSWSKEVNRRKSRGNENTIVNPHWLTIIISCYLKSVVIFYFARYIVVREVWNWNKTHQAWYKGNEKKLCSNHLDCSWIQWTLSDRCSGNLYWCIQLDKCYFRHKHHCYKDSDKARKTIETKTPYWLS